MRFFQELRLALSRPILKLLAVRSGVKLGKNVHVGPFTVISSPDELTIGHDVYVGKFCTIQVSGRIGNGVLIGNSVGIVGRNDHDIDQPGVLLRDAWVGNDPSLAGSPTNRVDIGDDVWIGYGATVLSGIRIGRGAIIAAAAVVTHDVEDYGIAVGAPARVIAKRFGGDTSKTIAHSAEIERRYGNASHDLPVDQFQA